jgi:hypothetical protein
MTRLSDLLVGCGQDPDPPGAPGAELLVTDPDDSDAFQAALARHFRFQQDREQIIWIRPIVGGYAPADPASEHDYLFSLNIARRRGLSYDAVRLDHGDIVLHLTGGQTARIRPASMEARTQLWLWDQFLADTLTPDQAAELARLQEDSWQGPFA